MSRARKRITLWSWLMLLVMAGSMLTWLPAAAQDPTAAPTSDASTLQDEPITTLEDTPIVIESITIDCATVGGTTVAGTLAVPVPEDGVIVELQLLAGETLLRERDVTLNGTDTEYDFTFALESGDAASGSSVVVDGREKDTEAERERSDSLAITSVDGATLCGTVDTPTPIPSPTPTATATATATASETASATQSATATSTASATASASASASASATATATATPTQTPSAATYGTVANTGGVNLRCRTAPVSGDVITLLAPGTRVETRGAAVDGWYPVKCGGRDGWVSGQYLQVDSAPSTATPTPDSSQAGTVTVVNTGDGGLRCRTAPVDGAIITVVAEGAKVQTRGAATNGWVPVRCSSQDGWMSAQYLRMESGTTTPTPTPTLTDPGSGGTGKYGTVVNTGGDNLRCRTARVTGTTITLVPMGTRLETRGAAIDGWQPVICNSQAGWVSSAYFQLEGTTTPPPSGTGKYAMVSGTGGGGLRCRTEPVDGAVITVLAEGARVQTRGSSTNGWTPIVCSGQNGWASSTYLLFDPGSGSGELWFDVDLGDQYMRVYRGNTLLRGFYVSTGKPRFETPTGTFYVNTKIPSQTMSGVLQGEYYYVPNVPWVMYFTNRGHAIHGAYWHDDFGTPRSHGCINLPVSTAEWLYGITPIGTRVRIHW